MSMPTDQRVRGPVTPRDLPGGGIPQRPTGTPCGPRSGHWGFMARQNALKTWRWPLSLASQCNLLHSSALEHDVRSPPRYGYSSWATEKTRRFCGSYVFTSPALSLSCFHLAQPRPNSKSWPRRFFLTKGLFHAYSVKYRP